MDTIFRRAVRIADFGGCEREREVDTLDGRGGVRLGAGDEELVGWGAHGLKGRFLPYLLGFVWGSLPDEGWGEWGIIMGCCGMDDVKSHHARYGSKLSKPSRTRY